MSSPNRAGPGGCRAARRRSHADAVRPVGQDQELAVLGHGRAMTAPRETCVPCISTRLPPPPPRPAGRVRPHHPHQDCSRDPGAQSRTCRLTLVVDSGPGSEQIGIVGKQSVVHAETFRLHTGSRRPRGEGAVGRGTSPVIHIPHNLRPGPMAVPRSQSGMISRRWPGLPDPAAGNGPAVTIRFSAIPELRRRPGSRRKLGRGSPISLPIRSAHGHMRVDALVTCDRVPILTTAQGIDLEARRFAAHKERDGGGRRGADHEIRA
jgi:hypothetical protein